MNTFSHILIGKLLYVYMKSEYGICLDRKSFVRGNYLPDFSIGLVTSPHYIKYKLKFVEREIAALSERHFMSADIGKENSRRLGIICHYIADFFCFAHSERFCESMAAHVDYERRLHRFLMVKQSVLSGIRFLPDPRHGANPASISAALGEYHADYMRASRSMGNDVVFSLQVCIDTIVSLILSRQYIGGPSEHPALKYLVS